MSAPDLPRRPLPALDALNEPFWTSGRDGVLRFLHCARCDRFVHPPSPRCPSCLARELAPRAVSGQGTVLTFTINHQPWIPGFEPPYVIAIVGLDEQADLRLTTNIVDCSPDDVHVGQRVEVRFEDHEGVWIPLFKPAAPPREAAS